MNGRISAHFDRLADARRAEEELFVFGIPRDRIQIHRCSDEHETVAAAVFRAGETEGGLIDVLADAFMPDGDDPQGYRLDVEADATDLPACRAIIEESRGRPEPVEPR